MSQENLGNQLYQRVATARGYLFGLGELAQLSYKSFEISINSLEGVNEDTITVSYPIGWRPDKQTITGTRTYTKDELKQRLASLADFQLSINSVLQMVTICEALFEDILRIIIFKYPQKLGGKRTIPIQCILESSNISELHSKAIDFLLNELSYKSPQDFAESFHSLTSINLLESPAFHKYMEIKATRDIHIHNRGIANETYLKKSGSHARVKIGFPLPIDTIYFLESYESCIQITEWLENQLHEHWHSSEYETRQNANKSIDA